MWILSTEGFLSIVQKPWDKLNDTLTVRARREADLEAFRQVILKSLGGDSLTISYDAMADYGWRFTATREEVAVGVAVLARKIDYPNFKNAVRDDRGGQGRLTIYHNVWWALLELQHPRPERALEPGLGLDEEVEALTHGHLFPTEEAAAERAETLEGLGGPGYHRGGMTSPIFDSFTPEDLGEVEEDDDIEYDDPDADEPEVDPEAEGR